MIDLIKLLIESGADVTAKDQFGKTYTDYLKTNVEDFK